MKRISHIIYLLFLITPAIAQSSFNNNECLQNIEEHNYHNESLALNLCHITDEDMPFVCQYISEKGIKDIYLEENEITAKGAMLLAENQSLEFLMLGHNNIGDEGAVALAQIKSLISLDLEANPISDNGLVAISQNPSLRTFIFGPGLFKEDSLINFFQNTSVGLLSIKKITLTHRVAEALGQNSRINSLFLNQVNVDDKDFALIAKLPNTNWFELINSSNGDAAAKAFSTNTSIEQLKFIDSPLSDAGFAALSTMENLKVLDVGEVPDPEPTYLTVKHIQYLNKLPHLEALYIMNAKINEEIVAEIAKNQTIDRLYLINDQISDAGAKYLAQNTSSTWMILQSNNIHDEGAFELAKNTNLKLLLLNDNPIGKDGIAALKANTNLEYLSVDEVEE